MTNLPEDVTKIETAAQTAVTTSEAWYSKAVTWVVGNAGKVVIGVAVLVALVVWKLL